MTASRLVKRAAGLGLSQGRHETLAKAFVEAGTEVVSTWLHRKAFGRTRRNRHRGKRGHPVSPSAWMVVSKHSTAYPRGYFSRDMTNPDHAASWSNSASSRLIWWL